MFTKTTTDYATMSRAELSKILKLNSVTHTASNDREELVQLAITNSINPDGTKGAIGNPTADIIFASKGKKHEFVVRVGDSVDDSQGNLTVVTKDMQAEHFFVASEAPEGKDSRHFYPVYITEEDRDTIAADSLVLLHETRSKYDGLKGLSYGYIFGYKSTNKAVSFFGLEDEAVGAGVKLAYLSTPTPFGFKGFVLPNHTIKVLVLSDDLRVAKGKSSVAYTFYKGEDSGDAAETNEKLYSFICPKTEAGKFLPDSMLEPVSIKAIDLSIALNIAIFIASEARDADADIPALALQAYIGRISDAIAKNYSQSVSRDVLAAAKTELTSLLGAITGIQAPAVSLPTGGRQRRN